MGTPHGEAAAGSGGRTLPGNGRRRRGSSIVSAGDPTFVIAPPSMRTLLSAIGSKGIELLLDDEHDRAPVREPPEEGGYRTGRACIQFGGRFVQDQDLCPQDEGCRDSDPLLLPPGEGGRDPNGQRRAPSPGGG